MASNGRSNGGDSLAAGRARQRIKIAAVGYYGSRHGIDATEKKLRASVDLLCKMAIEFGVALGIARGRRIDLYRQVDDEVLEMLLVAAIAYASARHGVDADVGMAREGLAVLCQFAIDFVEALPKEETRRSAGPQLHLGNGGFP